MAERESKQFLVKFGANNRFVRVESGGDLRAEIRRTFADLRRVKEGSRLVIQIRVDDSAWAGEFVDLTEDQLQTVPNKSVLQVVPEDSSNETVLHPPPPPPVSPCCPPSTSESASCDVACAPQFQTKLSISCGEIQLSKGNPGGVGVSRGDYEYIRAKATIYGRDPGKKITHYQQEINKAALELALEDSNLLLSKQKLLENARAKVNQVYNFKKGKSRSKESKSSGSGDTPKRPKTTEALRLKHIGEIEDDIRDLGDQLEFKRKRRDQAELSRNYRECDQLTEEMGSLKKRKREIEEELRLWKRKEQQGRWYKRSKKSCSSTSESESDRRLQRTRSLSSTPAPSSQSSRANSPTSLSSTPFSSAPEVEPALVAEEPSTPSRHSSSISPALSPNLITESPLPHSSPGSALGSSRNSSHVVDLTGSPDFDDNVRNQLQQSSQSPVDQSYQHQTPMCMSTHLSSDCLDDCSTLDFTTPIELSHPTRPPSSTVPPTRQSPEEFRDLSVLALATSNPSSTVSTAIGSANRLLFKDSADIALSSSPTSQASGQASTSDGSLFL